MNTHHDILEAARKGEVGAAFGLMTYDTLRHQKCWQPGQT